MNIEEQNLVRFLRKNPRSSIAEMIGGTGIKSNYTLYKILDSLEEQSIIRRGEGWRNVEVISGEDVFSNDEASGDVHRIPLLGTVAAGHPIEAILIPEWMEVPASMLKQGKEYFGLRVKGDSMRDAHIIDGDLIALQKSETAENGDIVVALVDGENATVKTFRREGGVIKLIPANSQFNTIFAEAERVTIQGIFVGLIRFGKQ